MAANAQEIVRSYRNLYRHGLRAVQYSTRARNVFRNDLQHAYRSNCAADFDAGKIENTLKFLISAAKEKGWAHRILKNLVLIGAKNITKRKPAKWPATPLEILFKQRAYEHFNITLRLFNENFGLCLPMRDFHDSHIHVVANRSTLAIQKS